MKTNILVVICLFVAVGAVPSQENGGSSGQESSSATIESLYLNSSLGMSVIRSQLETGSREQQILALSVLNEQIRRGEIDGTDPRVFAMVRFAMDQGVNVQARLYGGTDLTDYRPLVRREAARVMGSVATREAHDFLVQAVLKDPEPSVRSQAAFSLAQMNLDDGGESIEAITQMVVREHMVGRDEGSIFASLSALAMFPMDPDEHQETRNILVEIAQDFLYPRVVREKAIEVLSGM